MTTCAAIRKLLMEGPSTSLEIAAVLGIPKQQAHVGVKVLHKLSHIEFAMMVRHDKSGPGRNRLKAWQLTPIGRALSKRRKQEG